MNDDKRPDPDVLLKRVQDAAAKEGRARLKIWFGMAPGVGKTFAMLEAAQRARGEDVVVGWAETHGRKDTAALLEGLEVLPARETLHRGAKLRDFDLDAALARKPKTLLLDELAHTNAPGGRHLKRWQDVLDLLDAGIDVETTLNVQHVDSLNDVIKDVTGVVVRETVPDHILDRADEIELIDLPPDQLLERLREGKVYMGEQATRAGENFFRRGNLLALRELALRRTADRVDADVRAWREEHAIASAWTQTEKILVCVGASPGSSEVVRAARRLADRLHAPWLAVHVEATDQAPLSDEGRARVGANMRLAESLGAETAWLAGQRSAETIVAHARAQHVTRVLVGKHLHSGLRRLRGLWRPTLIDALLARGGDLEIDVVACAARVDAPVPITRAPSPRLDEYLWATMFVALATSVSHLARSTLAQPDYVMLYLVAIMLVSARFGRGPSVFSAGLSVLCYDFFFVSPIMTFSVSDWRHLLTFATMFAVGLLISTLALRVRRQEAAARARETRTAVLFQLARDLGAAPETQGIATTATRHAARIFDAEATILAVAPAAAERNAPDGASDEGALVVLAQSGVTALGGSDLAVARWSVDHERPAGLGADALPGARIGAFPLGGVGVMALLPKDPATLLDSETRHFAELFTRQIGLALSRAAMSEAVRTASVRAETEEMRSTLLSTVSHDLRTPLAAITGAATTLRDPDALTPEVRRELVDSICEEASRLAHLVANLLDMTRLESGAVNLRREWVPTEELVGSVLVRFERELGTRPVRIDIKPAVAYLHIDLVLFGQLLGNLVENAIKYSPAGAPIEIAVTSSLRGAEISVRDHGPGFPPGTEARVFDRFYRADTRVEGADEQADRGAGLGLAIARAIAHVHGGEMAAMTQLQGGAIVTCTLPSEAAAGILPPVPDEPRLSNEASSTP